MLEDNKETINRVKELFEKNDVGKLKVYQSIDSFKFEKADLYIFDIQLERKTFSTISKVRYKTNKPIITETIARTSIIIAYLTSSDCGVVGISDNLKPSMG